LVHENGDTVTTNDKPFLYVGGRFIESIVLLDRTYDSKPTTDVKIDLGRAGLFTIPVTHMNPLLVAIVERMYDEGTLTMETAERLSYLAAAYLAATDPRCDYCDKTQESTSDLEWNGETGNHIECESSLTSLHAPGWTEPDSIPAPGKPQSVIYTRPEA
jgi:hypothetical protein